MSACFTECKEYLTPKVITMPIFTPESVLLQVQLEIDREDLKAASIWSEWLRRQNENEAYSVAVEMLAIAGWNV
jgi:hypothetical protein